MAKLFLLLHHHLLLLLLLLLLPTYLLTAAETGSLPSPPPEGDTYKNTNKKFNTTTAIIVVAFTCAFLAIGCLSLCLHHYEERSSRERARLGAAAALLCCRMPKGLEPEVIEAYFPTFLYSDVKGIKTIDDDLECAVCLNEFEDDETLRLIPKCSHVFHPDCIGDWLSSHTTCPVCRADLDPTTKDLSLSSVQMSEPENYSVEPEDQFTTNNEQNHIVIHVGPGENQEVEEVLETQSPNVNLLNPINLNRKRTPLCSSPLGWRLDKLFSMSSFSTESSMVQPGENCERFTLKLSQKMQTQLMTSRLSDIRCESFSKERSARKGYKSDNNVEIKRSKNQFYYDRFNPGGSSGSDLTRSI